MFICCDKLLKTGIYKACPQFENAKDSLRSNLGCIPLSLNWISDFSFCGRLKSRVICAFLVSSGREKPIPEALKYADSSKSRAQSGKKERNCNVNNMVATCLGHFIYKKKIVLLLRSPDATERMYFLKESKTLRFDNFPRFNLSSFS
ncbi:hypothetical protein AVEN_271838-1 [Araneus ventricosus]|uniref:Uncharacterized protein n=1 Tax=Araneus ventricosus TaxID=182803 RepID=A0A4Y2N619_ARAVE|nr:hypothetical protein AVEN_271838-1 [Araneus ventricosus]